MSYPITSRATHPKRASAADEAEYDRLRGLAREEHGKRAKLSAQSQAAYKAGDGARAKELSEQAKQHLAAAEGYNAQARDWIFRVNNAGLPRDEIDLHGLFVEEAVEIVRARMQEERRRGGKGLWVIVGKGNHSEGGVAKLKPAVEKFCREEGLVVSVDPRNEGRVWIALEGVDGGQDDAGLLGKLLGFLFRKVKKACCVVM